MDKRLSSLLIASIIVLVSGIVLHFSFVRSIKLPEPETTIILTGDIMLGRSVMGTSLSKHDPSYPFRKVSAVLKKANIVFGNLENPIISICPPSDSGFTFCADPKMIYGLTYAGVSVVNLANNHTKNYGEDGLIQTEKYLTDNGISYVGAENLVTKVINGTRFGFLGFYLIDRTPSDADYQLIKDSKKKVDVLLVMVHWGIEYTSEPTDSQRSTAKDIVAAGADVIVGSHPHWVQTIDTINGTPVFYSLGNFVLDQAWSEETKKGLAIRLTFTGNRLAKVEKLPVYMKNFAQPEWAPPSTIISE